MRPSLEVLRGRRAASARPDNLIEDLESCAIAAPEVFGADDIGNAVILVEGEIPAELEAKTRRAVGNCPEHALTIED